MGTTTAGIVFLVSLVLALARVVPAARRLHGAGLHRASTTCGSSAWIYRATGVNPDAEQKWRRYLRSVLAFSLVSVLFLYVMLRLRATSPTASASPACRASQSFNTAASFTTNTNWQSYSGESALGYTAQMAGLAVQNFASAAVGIAVAIALVRGFARSRTDQLGNFWVDLVRTCIRILLPISVLVAVVFIAGGAIENFHALQTVHTHRRRHPVDHRRPGRQPGGDQAARNQRRRLLQRQLRAPVREPDRVDQLAADLPLARHRLRAAPHLRPDGRRQAPGPRDRRGDGGAVPRQRVSLNVFQDIHHGTVPTAVGAATEGTEQRFGVPDSATFASATTLTSTGAVDSFHDSYTSLGGAVTLLDMQLGEIAPGGTGSGLYGMLVLAVITVFVAGLMVGRTPEYLKKKIAAREIKFASLYFLTTPLFVLVGAGIAMALPGERAGDAEHGRARLLRGLYAFTSAGEQQRLGLRRHQRQHRLVQHRARHRDARRTFHPDDLRPRPGRIARQAADRAGLGRHPADPPAVVHRRWSSASRSSSSP